MIGHRVALPGKCAPEFKSQYCQKEKKETKVKTNKQKEEKSRKFRHSDTCLESQDLGGRRITRAT
jgi:hypothetical protein